MINHKLILALAGALAAIAAYGQKPDWQTWEKGPKWLENTVIYQIYPSSFKDSDGNGIGDIPGVLSRMDYIQSLGVGAIWFNPLFVSGWIDGGYDILDYYKVDPRFGTNTDLVKLIEDAHKRGIKVLLDLVPGHTSFKHPWFLQSMEADTNQHYSDYFIWSDRLPDEKAEKDLKQMLESDNVMQHTTGKWMVSDAPRAKYYYKNFYAVQPALNFGYANPDPSHPWEQSVDAPGPRAVKQELKDIMSFWFDKGVDGFRVDMAGSLVKNDTDKQETMKLWRGMREWMDANYPDRVLMAEWNDPEVCLAGGFNIDMDLISTRADCRLLYFDRKHQADGGCYFSPDGGKPSVKDLYGNPWPENKIDRNTTPEQMLDIYYKHFTHRSEATSGLGYYATISGNHDHLRLNTGKRNTPEQLKVMLGFVLSMPLPILYYGDEIGLRSLADLPNVEGANHNGKERAGGRTPMQWDGSRNAGFSDAPEEKLYLPVCPEWTPATSLPLYLEWKRSGGKPVAGGAITVESQDHDPQSLLNWVRALIALRKDTPAFWGDGSFEPVRAAGHAYPMTFIRSDGQSAYLVALNPTAARQKVVLDIADRFGAGQPATALCSGKAVAKKTSKGISLDMRPFSALITKIK